MREINVLSFEECLDKTYGETIVQYSSQERISFAFSQVTVDKVAEDPAALVEDLRAQLDKNEKMPLWSLLSDNLLAVVTENPFDMHFVEYDDEGWCEEDVDALFAEICARGLLGVVTCGEDGALVTVYAGAMGSINWTGHPVYGKPCFEKIIAGVENLQVVDSYSLENAAFYTVSLAPGFCVDVKVCEDTGLVYVMENGNGSKVYRDGDCDSTFPNYTFDEEAVIHFVKAHRSKESAPASLDTQISAASSQVHTPVDPSKNRPVERQF